MDLRDLRLDTAHALLAHGAPPGQAPLPYLQSLIDGLCELSPKDPLTGLASRGHLRALLEREIDRVQRSGEAALLLMLGVDQFEPLSEAHGPAAGERALQSVARTLAACVRPMDSLARQGGAEFALLLPACPMAFGRGVAERLRRAVASAPVGVTAALELAVSVSIGGAYATQWLRPSAAQWAERAGQQLQLARSGAAGGGRVSIEEQADDSTVSAEEKSLLFGPLRATSSSPAPPLAWPGPTPLGP